MVLPQNMAADRIRRSIRRHNTATHFHQTSSSVATKASTPPIENMVAGQFHHVHAQHLKQRQVLRRAAEIAVPRAGVRPVDNRQTGELHYSHAAHPPRQALPVSPRQGYVIPFSSIWKAITRTMAVVPLNHHRSQFFLHRGCAQFPPAHLR